MSRILDELAFMQFLKVDCGYLDPRPIANGRYAAIRTFIFTHAIVVGRIGDEVGYDDRWCYHDYAAAKAALDAWDGAGEPSGWHRHPNSGRRRQNGNPAHEEVYA